MLQFFAAACLLFSFSAFGNPKFEEAQEAYAGRDYNEAGIENVEKAIGLYDEAIGSETDAHLQTVYKNHRSDAYYFLGTALQDREERKTAHLTAMEIADDVISTLGVDPETAHELSESDLATIKEDLNDDQELVLVQAFYAKGTNLGQWGRLNGISSSIGRLPIVLGLMERIETLGYEHINEYGPARTVGRANFILPSIFGGDIELSEELLTKATRETLAPGQRYSINGYNNVYLAETLHKRGKEAQAKAVLNAFVGSDPATLSVGDEPENREALRLAQELLADWES